MHERPSVEADDRSINQKIIRYFWNSNVHFHSHKNPPLFPVLSQLNLVHTLASYLRSILILFSHVRLGRSHGSSVTIVTRLRAGRAGIDSRQGLGIFLLATASRLALKPTQPPIQCEPETLSTEVKRPGREADHSPPSSTEVKNVWSNTSTPAIRLHGVVRSQAQGQQYFFYLIYA
jgi:hypothetical protein